MTMVSRSPTIFLLSALLFSPIAVQAQTSCTNALTAEDQVASMLTLESRERAMLRAFYTAADKAQPAGCVWTDDEVAALRTVLSHAADQGLDPERYHPVALGGPAAPVRDLSATAMALRYAHDMVMGEVDEARLWDDVDVPRPSLDLPLQLTVALGIHLLGPWLAELPPADPQYARLLQSLARYRNLASQMALPPVPDGPKLTVGQSDARIVALKARLRLEGDFISSDSSPLFDDSVRRAVVSFQRRHGIKPDGLVGRDTLAALNVSAGQHLRQIIANLERRRFFGHVVPATRIEVNTAGATMTLFRDGQAALGMRAVVGDPKHPSPMLVSSRVDAIELNPPWVIPTSIIDKEMLPKEARDPGYFERHDIHWSGRQLVQSPGPKNALGRVKFVFANRFSVYLHDTPARSLFAKYDRADSHGCVRLENPMGLALALLQGDDKWPRDRIEKTIADGHTRRIGVKDGPAVVLTYWTVFADNDGTVEFRDDIYGRDAELIAAMPSAGVDEPVADAQ
jgi:murein L,D-transpeptidase YcbB/YkuD